MVLQPSPVARRVYYCIEHPAADLVLATVVGAGFTLLCGWQKWGQIIASADPPTRRALFQVVATFSGTLLGLTLTSLSVLVGLIRTPVPQLEAILPGNRKVRIARTFVSALIALGFVFLLALWALVNNTKDNSHGSAVVQSLVLGGLCLAALRIARVIWILWKMLVITAQASGPRSTVEDGS